MSDNALFNPSDLLGSLQGMIQDILGHVQENLDQSGDGFTSAVPFVKFSQRLQVPGHDEPKNGVFNLTLSDGSLLWDEKINGFVVDIIGNTSKGPRKLWSKELTGDSNDRKLSCISLADHRGDTPPMPLPSYAGTIQNVPDPRNIKYPGQFSGTFSNIGPCDSCQFGQWKTIVEGGKKRFIAPPCETSPVVIFYVFNWDLPFVQSLRDKNPNPNLPFDEGSLIAISLQKTQKIEAFDKDNPKGLATMFRTSPGVMPQYVRMLDEQDPTKGAVMRTVTLNHKFKNSEVNSWWGWTADWEDMADEYAIYITARIHRAMQYYKEENLLHKMTVEPYTRSASSASHQLQAPMQQPLLPSEVPFDVPVSGIAPVASANTPAMQAAAAQEFEAIKEDTAANTVSTSAADVEGIDWILGKKS